MGPQPPQLIATVKTGDLPHGLWGSGDGSRVYVGLENGDAVQAIDTADQPSGRRPIPVGAVAPGSRLCVERSHFR